MPRLSRWAIKIALLHFGLGIVLGAFMLAGKAGYGEVGLLSHRLVHIHMLFFGWLVQLVVGVGYWVLPTFSKGDRRGRSGLTVASVVVLNIGVVVGTAAPWVSSAGPAGWLFESIAVLLFGLHAWPRVKGGSGG